MRRKTLPAFTFKDDQFVRRCLIKSKQVDSALCKSGSSETFAADQPVVLAKQLPAKLFEAQGLQRCEAQNVTATRRYRRCGLDFRIIVEVIEPFLGQRGLRQHGNSARRLV